MSALLALRSLLRGSDGRRAAVDEARRYAADDARAREGAGRQRDAYEVREDGGLVLGAATAGGWPVGLPAGRVRGHSAIFGPSGAGKSYLLAVTISGLLRGGARRLLILDPKTETVDLVKRVIVDYAHTLCAADREDLLGRIVCLDLFGSDTLPRLQILAPTAGLDPELHAFEVSNLVTTELDQAAGVRQEWIFHRTIECLVRAALPLTALPAVLENPEILDALAETTAPADLFRSTAARLRKESKDRIQGCVSRIERLLRLKSTRLALGGSQTCIDFVAQLDSRITLVNLAPPAGSVDIGRFMAGMFWIALSHAIRRRSNGASPCFVVVDEWPTFLAGGGARLSDSFEDILRLARSRGVYLTVLAQEMASVEKVSGSLSEVLKNNMHYLSVFRAATDAAVWDFILPISGRERKPAAASWVDAKPAFLDRASELALRRSELSRLPDRECYFADRRTGLPGVRMRTADLVLKAAAGHVRALEARAAAQPEVASVAELETGLHGVAGRIEALSGAQRPGAPKERADAAVSAVAPLRRKGRGVGIG